MSISHAHHRIIFVSLIVISFYLSSVAIIYASDLITHEINSKEIAMNLVGISSIRKFQVYIPNEYNIRKDMRYPVLYWIPGWGSGLTGMKYKDALDNAILSGAMPATIAVFIDVHEYLWCLNSPAFGNWENFIGSELVQFMDREYRTIPNSLARAIMGHSAGGYTAFMLPVRNPKIWGSLGSDDPALCAMWVYIRDKEDSGFELVEDYTYDGIQAGYKNLPKNIGDYKSVEDWYTMDLLQFGTTFSPNPNVPLFCDFPINDNGEWIPEVREKWSKYDLSNPDRLAEYSEILKSMLSIVIVVPSSSSLSYRNHNIKFIEQLESAGIHVTRLDMPGAHGDGESERFIEMAKVILRAMIGAEASVSSGEKLVETWGAIKQK